MQLLIERLNQGAKLEFHLPTEAQWEYAAKGGKYSKDYLYSGSNHIDDVAWYGENAERRLHPVATKQANELGLFDMTGNVWEFCLDDMSRKAYHRNDAIDPVIIVTKNIRTVSMKVIRGSGYEFSANESELFKRDGATSNVRMPDIVFRLAIKKIKE